MDYAALNGCLETVKWLHLNRSEGCDHAILYATVAGKLSVVKYLVENRLGVDRIQEAIDLPSSHCYTGEGREKLQEIKSYLRSL